MVKAASCFITGNYYCILANEANFKANPREFVNRLTRVVALLLYEVKAYSFCFLCKCGSCKAKLPVLDELDIFLFKLNRG